MPDLMRGRKFDMAASENGTDHVATSKPAWWAFWWSLAFGLLSLYWAAGGELGVSTLAQSIQDRTRDGDSGMRMLTAMAGLLKVAGDSLRGVTLDDLGRARRAWCDRKHVGIISGKGDPRALRRQIAALKCRLEQIDEPQQRKALRQRIGRLSGGAAILTIGGATESEIALREERAKRTTELLRAALREGVVPGGGVALLACRERLRAMLEASADLDEQVAYRILIRALEEPLRVIASNAGYEPADVLAQLHGAPPGFGFDVRSGQVVAMAEAGIYDVAAAQKAAIRGAISGAATALTVDTIVHKRNRDSAGGHP